MDNRKSHTNAVPLELSCDVDITSKECELDPKAEEFKPRRRAAQAAEDNVKQTFIYEDKDVGDDV